MVDLAAATLRVVALLLTFAFGRNDVESIFEFEATKYLAGDTGLEGRFSMLLRGGGIEGMASGSRYGDLEVGPLTF